MPRPEPARARDLIELLLGYGLILFILWMPETPQRILTPVALLVTLAMVLAPAKHDPRSDSRLGCPAWAKPGGSVQLGF